MAYEPDMYDFDLGHSAALFEVADEVEAVVERYSLPLDTKGSLDVTRVGEWVVEAYEHGLRMGAKLAREGLDAGLVE